MPFLGVRLAEEAAGGKSACKSCGLLQESTAVIWIHARKSMHPGQTDQAGKLGAAG